MNPNQMKATGGAAEYPEDLDDSFVLPNGRRLRVRALHRGEEGPIRELDAHLSLGTRYRRFFSPMPTLSDASIRALASVDYRRQVALVAEHDNGHGAEIIGLGSFAAIDDSRAEVAVVVRDEWQQQRVGTELATRVLQAAEHRGFHQFIFWVQSDNVAIRRLLKRLGHVVSARISGGISEFAFVRRAPAP